MASPPVRGMRPRYVLSRIHAMVSDATEAVQCNFLALRLLVDSPDGPEQEVRRRHTLGGAQRGARIGAVGD